jgi:ribonucleoside-diphosphate reductase alpha chain
MINEEYTVPIISGRGWGGLPEPSKILYKDRYFQPDEDYEVWLDRITRPFCDSREHRGRMKQYIRNHWFHPATPVSANGGIPQQGFTVSCFVQSVGDSKEEIMNAWEEGFYLGAKGAGIGRYWGNVRSAGEKVGVKG